MEHWRVNRMYCRIGLDRRDQTVHQRRDPTAILSEAQELP
jgi:hypothetical protein